MLGNIISAQRKKLGLTQEQLAQKLDVTNQAVSKWETDQSCPDVAMLPRLAELFGISMDELFGREIPVRETVQDLPWEDDDAFRIVLYQGRQLLRKSKNAKQYTFTYEGPVRDIYCDLNMECGSVGGSVTAGGYVECEEVGGNVIAEGYVECGSVGGDIKAGGYAECEEVAGHVSAGGYVECNAIAGNVTAGGYAECDAVEGSVCAGSYVECDDVGGSVSASSYVECGDVGGDVTSGDYVECGDIGGNVSAQGDLIQGADRDKSGFKITIDDDKDDKKKQRFTFDLGDIFK